MHGLRTAVPEQRSGAIRPQLCDNRPVSRLRNGHDPAVAQKPTAAGTRNMNDITSDPFWVGDGIELLDD